MTHDLETIISRRFEELAESAMFPQDVAPDDFELRATLDWLGNVRSRLVLDVGCAKGRFVKALSHLGARVIGADPTWKLILAASRNAPGCAFALSTATRLPFLGSTYDGALCIEVIEHIPDLDRALGEIARTLKPGGRAIIIDKNLLGLGFYRFYPNWLYKAAMERLGRWPYPADFPFSERWYTSWSVRRKLRRHFARVEVRYLDGRVRGSRRRLLAPLFKVFPFLRPDIAWCCER